MAISSSVGSIDSGRISAIVCFPFNRPNTNINNQAIIGSAIIVANNAKNVVEVGIAASKGEGRRLIEQGGVSVDDVKVTDIYQKFTKEQLSASIKIKKGKKVFHKVNM